MSTRTGVGGSCTAPLLGGNTKEGMESESEKEAAEEGENLLGDLSPPGERGEGGVAQPCTPRATPLCMVPPPPLPHRI